MMLKDRLDAPWTDAATLDQIEVDKFTALAEEWWNPAGKFKPIHKFNPIRLDYIIQRTADRFGRDPKAETALSGLRILDVGCGAGLLSEPLAKRGAHVVGIDATARNIEVARWHASLSGLGIDYRHALSEHLAGSDERFDVVLNMEVIEHVTNPARLMADCADLVAPGGTMVVATLNRTLRAYLLAIVGAEYVLRWLPRGTHDWRRFLTPQEIRAMIEPRGLETAEVTGVSYNPIADRWRLSSDTGVNYLLVASKPE